MSTKVYFLYPFEGPTTSIALRRPSFGDSLDVNYQIQIKHSRSGQLFAYKRTPTYQSLKLTFEKMRAVALQGMSSRDQMQAFFALCAARQIRYIDHNGQNWSGVITTPVITFTNQGKDAYGDLFGFSIELEASPLVGVVSVGNR